MYEKTKGGKKEPKYIPLDELEKILNAPYPNNKKHRIMLRLGALCGMRGGEVIRLKKEDILISERKIRIVNSKGDKDRTIQVSDDDFLRELEKYIEDLPIDKPIFDDKMETTEGLTAMVKRYAKKMEIERNVTFHMLRHSFAVHSIKAGVNLRSLQIQLGHSSLTTTQIYLDVAGDDVAEDYRNHPLPYR